MMRVRLVPAAKPEVEYCYDRGYIVSVMFRTCTTLDHIYPSNRNKHGVMKPNTRCYCGKNRWGGTGLPIEWEHSSEPRAEKKVFTVRIKRRKAESPATEETVMAKKAAEKKAARSWNRTYEFVKPLKAEPPKGTIKAAVYAGIKSTKSGDADTVTAAAIKAGLKDATDQDPRVQTMVWLRALIADGSVRVVKADSAKTTAKPAVKKTGKRVVLKKAS